MINFSQYIFPNKANVISFNNDYRAKDDRLKELKNMTRRRETEYEIENPHQDWLIKRSHHKKIIKEIEARKSPMKRGGHNLKGLILLTSIF